MAAISRKRSSGVRSSTCMGKLLWSVDTHDDLGLASGAPSGRNRLSPLFTYPAGVRNDGLGLRGEPLAFSCSCSESLNLVVPAADSC